MADALPFLEEKSSTQIERGINGGDDNDFHNDNRDLVGLLYFGCLFDVQSQSDFTVHEDSIETYFNELQAKEAENPSSATAPPRRRPIQRRLPATRASRLLHEKGLDMFFTDNHKNDNLRTEVTATLCCG